MVTTHGISIRAAQSFATLRETGDWTAAAVKVATFVPIIGRIPLGITMMAESYKLGKITAFKEEANNLFYRGLASILLVGFIYDITFRKDLPLDSGWSKLIHQHGYARIEELVQFANDKEANLDKAGTDLIKANFVFLIGKFPEGERDGIKMDLMKQLIRNPIFYKQAEAITQYYDTSGTQDDNSKAIRWVMENPGGTTFLEEILRDIDDDSLKQRVLALTFNTENWNDLPRTELNEIIKNTKDFQIIEYAFLAPSQGSASTLNEEESLELLKFFYHMVLDSTEEKTEFKVRSIDLTRHFLTEYLKAFGALTGDTSITNQVVQKINGATYMTNYDPKTSSLEGLKVIRAGKKKDPILLDIKKEEGKNSYSLSLYNSPAENVYVYNNITENDLKHCLEHLKTVDEAGIVDSKSTIKYINMTLHNPQIAFYYKSQREDDSAANAFSKFLQHQIGTEQYHKFKVWLTVRLIEDVNASKTADKYNKAKNAMVGEANTVLTKRKKAMLKPDKTKRTAEIKDQRDFKNLFNKNKSTPTLQDQFKQGLQGLLGKFK